MLLSFYAIQDVHAAEEGNSSQSELIYEDIFLNIDVQSSNKNISCGIMYRKDLLSQFGMYNSNFRHREEEELRKRVGDYYKIHHLNIPFYRYRMHSSNKTKTKEYTAVVV